MEKTTFLICPDCKSKMSTKALQKTGHICPGCGRKKTSRPWKMFVE